MAISPSQGRFEPYILEPGAPSAFGCFGTWENVKTCQPIGEVDDALDGCSQSAECRRYTLEQNPPTTRFRVKPRRDGRFEIQQFRDFIRDQVSYRMEISEGFISITYPGPRNVPKSKRFFLHIKHIEQASLSIDGEFELVVSLERMLLRQAGSGPLPQARARQRPAEDDPDARRKRIAEKLRQKASESARSSDDDEDLELDIDIDLDLDLDDEDQDDEVATDLDLDATGETPGTVAKPGDESVTDEVVDDEVVVSDDGLLELEGAELVVDVKDVEGEEELEGV